MKFLVVLALVAAASAEVSHLNLRDYIPPYQGGAQLSLPTNDYLPPLQQQALLPAALPSYNQIQADVQYAAPAPIYHAPAPVYQPAPQIIQQQEQVQYVQQAPQIIQQQEQVQYVQQAPQVQQIIQQQQQIIPSHTYSEETGYNYQVPL